MKILMTISWRNIWRHPGRSGVLLASIIAGLWAGVMIIGLMNGMFLQRMDYLIDSEITHAQVHHPEFLTEGYSRLYIPNHEEIDEWLREDTRVRSHTLRTITDGMLQSPVKTSGTRIRGIDPERERETTTFHENIIDGEYLDSSIRNPVLVGKRLADTHNLEIGDRVVLTFEDINNELTSAAFNIAGIFESASPQYDDSNVFVNSEDIIRLIADRPVFHEIAMMLHREDDAEAVVTGLNERFSGIEAQTWYELSPEIRMMVEFGGAMLYIITLIIMLALAFGILNTMLMALFERMREIGVLLSIGMSRIRIFLMIMLEATILTLTGALAGIGLAWLSIRQLSESGINLEMFASGLAEIGWDHIIYPFVESSEFVAIVIFVIVITILATLYPAVKAMRVNPLEAARDT